MKVLFILAIAVLFSASSFAQGTLIFNNRTATGDAPFTVGAGRGAGSIPGMTAQLYLVGAGGALTPLYPTTTFRDSSEAAMYFVKEINPFVVNGVLPGESATFRIRVYQGSSYEAAVTSNCLFRLESNDVTVPQLGGTLPNGQVIPPPYLNGLQGAALAADITPQYIMFQNISIEGDQLRFVLDDNFDVGRGCWGTYVLEASPNLTAWQAPLLTNPPPSSFTIPYNPANERNRFFRLRTFQ